MFVECSVEVILRAEAVETAQAGDRCDFIGTLIVVPDVSSLSMPGELKNAVASSLLLLTSIWLAINKKTKRADESYEVAEICTAMLF